MLLLLWSDNKKKCENNRSMISFYRSEYLKSYTWFCSQHVFKFSDWLLRNKDVKDAMGLLEKQTVS